MPPCLLCLVAMLMIDCDPHVRLPCLCLLVKVVFGFDAYVYLPCLLCLLAMLVFSCHACVCLLWLCFLVMLVAGQNAMLMFACHACVLLFNFLFLLAMHALLCLLTMLMFARNADRFCSQFLCLIVMVACTYVCSPSLC